MNAPTVMRYTTSTAEGEAALRRKRDADAARAAATMDCLPPASARYRPTIDAPWLKRIVDRDQDPARVAPDRGGDPELVMPPRPLRGPAS